jgi:hypothetical protein
VCSEDVKAFVLPPCYASQDKPHRECGTPTSVNNLTRIPNQQIKASQGRKIYAGIKMHKCQVKKSKKENTQEILPQKKKKKKKKKKNKIKKKKKKKSPSQLIIQYISI